MAAGPGPYVPNIPAPLQQLYQGFGGGGFQPGRGGPQGSAPMPRRRLPTPPGQYPIYPTVPQITGKNYPGVRGDQFGKYGSPSWYQFYGPGGAFGNPTLDVVKRLGAAQDAYGGRSAVAGGGTQGQGFDEQDYADFLRKLLGQRLGVNL